jgi:hypothetical protein
MQLDFSAQNNDMDSASPSGRRVSAPSADTSSREEGKARDIAAIGGTGA